MVQNQAYDDRTCPTPSVQTIPMGGGGGVIGGPLRQVPVPCKVDRSLQPSTQTLYLVSPRKVALNMK